MESTTQSTITVTPIDFAQTSLADPYGLFYAKIIDGLFTPTDCERLLALASSSNGWQPAGLSTRGTEQTVHAGFRNSDRVLVIDDEHSAWIYEKLRPYVEEIHEIVPDGRWGCITGKAGKTQGPTWSLTGVNPRLSFLRYGPGHYFKPHCDGLIEVGTTKSFVTLHLYLNDSALGSEPLQLTATNPPPSTPTPGNNLPSSTTPFPTAPSPAPLAGLNQEPPAADGVPLHGGATRFWTPNKKAYLDVHPKLGRVLIFQQRMLVHSGEEVTQGIKYTMRSDFLFEQKGAQKKGKA
ncbi:hypothetical protein FPV67DRAFT_1666725 [Lyophyllum atratum]|nr:hypothetical protein FPV67DRAFT_1666725 [Lyophyllum atratum]